MENLAPSWQDVFWNMPKCIRMNCRFLRASQNFWVKLKKICFFIIYSLFFLEEFHAKSIRCYFDNKKLINSVNIVFICVLPSQLEQVVKDIRDNLPEKCIIYSLVRPHSGMQLKNLIYNGIVESFILRPEFSFNENFKQAVINWNYTIDILDCFSKPEIIAAINPFLEEEGF